MPAAEDVPPPCPSCGSPDTRVRFRGRDWEFGTPGEHTVYRCRACAWSWTGPPLTPAQLAALYPRDEYYAYRRAGRPLGGVRDAVIRALFGYPLSPGTPFYVRAFTKAAAPLLRRRYYNIPPHRPGGRLLDVGAGAGDYLGLVVALGWAADGIEVNAEAAAAARAVGLNVARGDAAEVLRSGVLAGPYDFIRVHHTLEHLTDCVEGLKAAAARARAGATLLVAVPNAGGWGVRFFGRHWYHWALPFHRNHFTPKTLRAALRAAGWRSGRAYFVSPADGLIMSVAQWAEVTFRVRIRPGERARRIAGKVLRPLLWLADVAHAGDNLIVEAIKD